jgi:hypothetical protein
VSLKNIRDISVSCANFIVFNLNEVGECS